jgi:transcriptional regulator with XRE-family HTH domain
LRDIQEARIVRLVTAPPDLHTVGGRIRAARLAADLTQEQLAEKAHVTQTQISDWERNRFVPELDNIRALAKALHKTVEDFLDMPDEADPTRHAGRDKTAKVGNGNKEGDDVSSQLVTRLKQRIAELEEQVAQVQRVFGEFGRALSGKPSNRSKDGPTPRKPARTRRGH